MPIERPVKRPLKTRDGTVPAPPPPTKPAVDATGMRRVRFLKSLLGSRRGSFSVGQVAYLPADVARDWMDMGLIELDKSLDAPPETK